MSSSWSNYARLVSVPGGLAFESSYHRELVDALKRQIPASARRWDGANKRWLVDASFGPICAQIAMDYLRVQVELPQPVAIGTQEVRLLRLEYLGQCKPANGPEPTAFGYVAGSWSALFSEPVLRAWFDPEPAKPGEQSTLYQVLNVKRDVAPDEIKKSFRRLAMQWHPDRCSEPDAAEQFKRIMRAYDVLSCPDLRRKYDVGLILEASMRDRERIIGIYQLGGVHYRSPLRCGLVLCEGIESLGRFMVSAILQWEDIVAPDGRVMVSSWPAGATSFLVKWV